MDSKILKNIIKEFCNKNKYNHKVSYCSDLCVDVDKTNKTAEKIIFDFGVFVATMYSKYINSFNVKICRINIINKEYISFL